MLSDAIIDIKGVQYIDDSAETIELSTEGRYGVKTGEYFISYSEGAMFDTPQDVKTVIHIKSDNSVVLERSGSLKSRMVIEEGKRNASVYTIPEGQIMINVSAEKVEYSLNSDGGSIELVYSIDSNMQLISKNKVNIGIKRLNRERS